MGVCNTKGEELAQETEGTETPRHFEATRGRRPYQKPAFRYERVFETMALSCGKVVTTQFQCHFHSKTS